MRPLRKGSYCALIRPLITEFEMTVSAHEGQNPDPADIVIPAGTIGRIVKSDRNWGVFQVHFPGYPGDELTDNGPNYQVITGNIRPLNHLEQLARAAAT